MLIFKMAYSVIKPYQTEDCWTYEQFFAKIE